MEEGEKNELYFLKSDGVIRKVYSNYIQIVLHYRFDYLMIHVQTVTMPTVLKSFTQDLDWCLVICTTSGFKLFQNYFKLQVDLNYSIMCIGDVYACCGVVIFLDTSSHLYTRVCPSVRRSVGRSVRPSVRMSRFCKKCMKLRVLCTEMIKKAYKVMNNIKTAL